MSKIKSKKEKSLYKKLNENGWQDPELCLEMVKIHGMQILFVKNQTLEMVRMALDDNPNNHKYIDKEVKESEGYKKLMLERKLKGLS